MLTYLEQRKLGQEAVRSFRLHRLPRGRYQEVILGPAQVAQRAGYPLQISEDLAEALSDAATESHGEVGDALPILALALQRLVKKRRASTSGEISLAPKDAAKFLNDAVAEAALEARTTAKADEAALRRLVIPELVAWDPRAGEGGAAKRQVAAEAVLFAGERAGLKPLANALVDQRLLTRSAGEDGAVYEVAHEALLRVSPLGEMITALKDKFVRAEVLTLEAKDWLDAKRSPDQLARRGGRLREARQLSEDPDFRERLSRPELGVLDYLKACEQAETEETARQRRLERGRLQAALVGLAVALCLAAVAGYFGWDASNQRDVALQEAERADTAAVRAAAEAENAP